MAPLTQWNPATQISRGNIAVGIAPAMVSISAPSVAELGAGVGLDCSIQTFNGTSSTSSDTIDWLCDPASEQLPGSTTHTIDDLVIKGTGQADASLITGLSLGGVIYIWRRDGLPKGTAVAAAQMIWVWKAIITSIDPLEANNTFVGVTVHVTVMSRTKTAVAVVA